MTTDRYYAVVAAVRIQSWLTRTPRLRLLRGGSALLMGATDAKHTSPVLESFHGVDLEPTAGHGNGVVAIVGDDPSAVADAQHALLSSLRGAAPGLQWDTWQTKAVNYPDAFRAAELRGPGVIRRLELPSQLDFPAVASCYGCGSEPSGAVVVRTGDDLQAALGLDCAERWQAGATLRAHDPPRDPETLEELATDGGLTADEAALGRLGLRNHLATITADGNNIGQLMTQLAGSSDAVVQLVMDGLGKATRSAVDDAGKAVTETAAVAGHVVHLVGGDDVFVSVPAILAWKWVRTFDAAFAHHIVDLVRTLPGGAPAEIKQAIGGLSMGIGMAFNDSSHPIADAHRLAERLLANAKQRASGSYSAASWLDLTVESKSVQAPFLALAALADIDRRTGAAAVLGLGPTARATLARVLRGEPNADVVSDWAYRIGQPELASATQRPDWRNEFDAMVSLARWWPTTNRETSD